MSLHTYSVVSLFVGIASLLVVSLIAATALAVAIVLTRRQTNRMAAWLLFLACGVQALLGLLRLILPAFILPLREHLGPAGLQWSFAAVGVVALGAGMLFVVALLLFRPGAAGEAGHGSR